MEIGRNRRPRDGRRTATKPARMTS